MPTYYVATGVSGGNGATDTPWNWDEMTGQTFASGDVIIIRTGTHAATAGWTASVSDLFIHGDFAQARPVIDFGSFSGKCLATTSGASALRIEFIELDAPSSSHAVDFDVAFNGSVLECKGTFFDIRAGRRSAYSKLEAENVQVSSSTIANSFISDVVSADSNFQGAITNCVLRQFNAVNILASVVSNSIIFGTGSAGGASVGQSVFSNCIFINATTAITSSDQVTAENCFFFNNTSNTSGNVRQVNSTDMTADPFVDAANLDFRLTTAAKAESYANQLKAIMAGLVDVPGITTDSLADLVGGGGGGGSSAFNSYQSAYYRG